MVNYERNEDAPDCLWTEQQKANGDYKCGDVLQRLQRIFHNKCYICELKAPTSVNVEHLRPHKGDKQLKFDWNNLFLACVHCNNTKSALEQSNVINDILDCTNENHKVDEWIDYHIDPWPKAKVQITSLKDNQSVHNTVELLGRVYNGHTLLKNLEASNLRKALLNEIRDFQKDFFEYDRANQNKDRAYYKTRIRKHLQNSSPFAAFKRWIVRKQIALRLDLADCLG